MSHGWATLCRSMAPGDGAAAPRAARPGRTAEVRGGTARPTASPGVGDRRGTLRVIMAESHPVAGPNRDLVPGAVGTVRVTGAGLTPRTAADMAEQMVGLVAEIVTVRAIARDLGSGLKRRAAARRDQRGVPIKIRRRTSYRMWRRGRRQERRLGVERTAALRMLARPLTARRPQEMRRNRKHEQVLMANPHLWAWEILRSCRRVWRKSAVCCSSLSSKRSRSMRSRRSPRIRRSGERKSTFGRSSGSHAGRRTS
mmetsp:Transcript_83810/g.270009  ORF Transcript_83810/g.270009 Transcript_83810/m.270009 type:complete len:255 (-) Transcript_83810:1044-1808(-)